MDKNNLWHKPTGDIDCTKPILVYLKNGNILKVRYIKQYNCFTDNNVFIEMNDIIKFLYLEDII